jgi:hypothetical protein
LFWNGMRIGAIAGFPALMVMVPVGGIAAPASERLIIYGGFGHLAHSAQPHFGDILIKGALRDVRAGLEQGAIRRPRLARG